MLRVWRLCDGRRGHENQSLGLVEALAERLALQCRDIHVPGAWRGTGAVLEAPPEDAPPRLIIGAGHATHLPLIVAARRQRARSVVLMNPSVPRALFDLCIVPAHDRVAEGGNVLVSLGALNRMRPGAARDPALALVLLGGPSRHHRWDTAAIAGQLRELVGAQPDRDWVVAGSPRTPAETLARLAATPPLRVVPFTDTDADWLPAQLARAGTVWVSEDSVSMAYEAVSCGAPTGLLEVPSRRRGRVHAAADALREAGLATAIADWRRGRRPAPAEPPLQEARRCAAALLARWPDLQPSSRA